MNSKNQITMEHTTITDMPKAVNRYKIVVENPDLVIRSLHSQVIKQAATILRLKTFADRGKDIFCKTMKGGRIVGVCPFSAN